MAGGRSEEIVMRAFYWIIIWFVGTFIISFVPDIAEFFGATYAYGQYWFGIFVGAWIMYLGEVRPSIVSRWIDKRTKEQ